MRRFKIYHATTPTFDLFDAATFPAGYDFVAVVEADGLDDAYTKTQNLDEPWHWKAGVVRAPLRANMARGERSTSVGDVIYDMDNGLNYAVSSVGFELVRHANHREKMGS